MKHSVQKVVALLGALAFASGLSVISASAHIGASHSPFTTEGPDLRSATIDDEEVQFCFDEEASHIVGDDPTRFLLGGYDSDTADDAPGESVDLSDEENCVEVDYDNTDQEVGEFTIAKVEGGAVEDRSGNENIESSVALTGGDRDDEEDGDTDAPNLTEVEVDEGEDEITYIFDADIDCVAGFDNNAFGFYTSDGDPDNGQTGDVCEDNEVTITFDNTDPDLEVRDAERFFVEADGVCGLEPSDDNCISNEHEGGDTNAPDLTDVERTDDDEVTFSFNEDVDTITSGSFHVVTEDGDDSWVASDCSEEDDSDVECTFEALEDAQDFELAQGNVAAGAVTAENGGQASTVGNAPLGATVIGSGFSDGPDLERCELDRDEEIARFYFDEDIDEGSATGSSFDVFDDDGHLTSGGDVDDSEEQEGWISVEFDEDAMEDAVGCHVDNDAVDDFLGNGSPFSSVGVTTESSPSPSPTQSTTTTVTPTDQTETVRAPSAVSVDYRRQVFSGDVRSDFAGCERSRRVVVKKRRAGADRVMGDDVTDNTGRYRISKRARRGRYYAVAQRKVFTAPNGDTVICTTSRSGHVRVKPR